MNQALFKNSPTCGSDEDVTEIKVVSCSQNETTETVKTVSECNASVTNAETKKKFKFKKLKKLFTTVVLPILTIIPKIINSIANLKRACVLTA